jgi:hypothetical protein
LQELLPQAAAGEPCPVEGARRCCTTFFSIRNVTIAWSHLQDQQESGLARRMFGHNAAEKVIDENGELQQPKVKSLPRDAEALQTAGINTVHRLSMNVMVIHYSE